MMSENEVMTSLKKIKQLSYHYSNLTTDKKNAILQSVAQNIDGAIENIIAANKVDIEGCKDKPKAFVDRLTLNEKRIKDMINGVREVIRLNDPCGEIVNEFRNQQNLLIKKVRVPIGVICVIYESRPNVTIDAASLCLKSGNCVVLRGGKEAINTNKVLVSVIKNALVENGVDSDCVCFIDNPDRELLYRILKMEQYIDLAIARGGEEMIRSIRENSLIPVLAHGKGLCHVYIDEFADIDMAIKIAYNAKVQRPGVCNAMETLLVHRNIAPKVLPRLHELYMKAGVELRGCNETSKIISVKPAVEEDWYTEYLDLILSIKIVNSLDEAIEHINKYGSAHSDAIVTESEENALKFMRFVDSSAVFWNASTRLHDGGVFGLGTEIGISTQKFHARGTMGLKELTTTKYLVFGEGHIRE